MERALGIWMACRADMNGKEYISMMQEFKSAGAAFECLQRHLGKGAGEGSESPFIKNSREKLIQSMDHHLTDKELLEFQNSYEKNGIRAVTILDGDYPDRLRDIKDAPAVLFVMGNWPVGEGEEGLSIGIVGARECSEYGIRAAEAISFALERKGVTIISGMARGIDGAAHRGALRGSGRTIAVLASGLMNIYPKENRTMFERIIRNGAVISEFPPYKEAQSYNFPRRNRVISGLSDGVLVVEASMRSGSLITVDYALAQGKDVFAIPGNINSPSSKGSNFLIKQGAKIVLSPEDILEEYGISTYDGRFGGECRMGREELSEDFLRGMGPTEVSICKLLVTKPMGIDQISARLRIDGAEITNRMVVLELSGAVYSRHGYYYLNEIER